MYNIINSTDDITCNLSEDCTVNCLSDESCIDLTINCPPNLHCAIICNSDRIFSSCSNLTIFADQSSSLTINDCNNPTTNDSCTDILVYCPYTSDPKTCEGLECSDICAIDTNATISSEDGTSAKNFWQIFSGTSISYYMVGMLALALACCFCVISFYVVMSLKYSRSALKHQLKAVSIAQSELENDGHFNYRKHSKAVQFGNEDRKSVDIVQLKVPHNSPETNLMNILSLSAEQRMPSFDVSSHGSDQEIIHQLDFHRVTSCSKEHEMESAVYHHQFAEEAMDDEDDDSDLEFDEQRINPLAIIPATLKQLSRDQSIGNPQTEHPESDKDKIKVTVINDNASITTTMSGVGQNTQSLKSYNSSNSDRSKSQNRDRPYLKKVASQNQGHKILSHNYLQEPAYKSSMDTVVSKLTSVSASSMVREEKQQQQNEKMLLEPPPHPQIANVESDTNSRKSSEQMNIVPGDDMNGQSGSESNGDSDNISGSASSSSSTATCPSVSGDYSSDTKESGVPEGDTNDMDMDEDDDENKVVLPVNVNSGNMNEQKMRIDRNLNHLQHAMKFLEQHPSHFALNRGVSQSQFTEMNINNSVRTIKCDDNYSDAEPSGIVGGVLGNMFGIKMLEEEATILTQIDDTVIDKDASFYE